MTLRLLLAAMLALSLAGCTGWWSATRLIPASARETAGLEGAFVSGEDRVTFSPAAQGLVRAVGPAAEDTPSEVALALLREEPAGPSSFEEALPEEGEPLRAPLPDRSYLMEVGVSAGDGQTAYTYAIARIGFSEEGSADRIEVFSLLCSRAAEAFAARREKEVCVFEDYARLRAAAFDALAWQDEARMRSRGRSGHGRTRARRSPWARPAPDLLRQLGAKYPMFAASLLSTVSVELSQPESDHTNGRSSRPPKEQDMAHTLELDSDRLAEDPLILTVPGLDNSGEHHWQTLWEAKLPDCERVELGMWDDPHRNTWVNKLNLAVHRARRPVILVAHSLGCHAVAWWAEYEQPKWGNPVVGALLVAPPDVEREGVDERLARFAPTPRRTLPFPTFLAASENDRYCSLRTARGLASDWGATFAYAGSVGHINADSGIEDWAFGQLLLAQLLREHRNRQGIGREHETETRRRAAARYTRLPWVHSAVREDHTAEL